MMEEPTLSAEKRKRAENFFRNALRIMLFIQVGGMFFSIALSSIAFGGAVGAFIGLLFSVEDKRSLLIRTGLEWYFVAYIVAAGLMVLFAIYPMASLDSSRRILLIAVVYLVPAGFHSKEDLIRFFLGLSVVVAVQSGIEFGFYLAGKLDRINLFQHYMTAGGMKMSVLMIMIPMLFLKNLSGKRRMILGVSTTIALITLVLTQTRSSWLGFAAGVLLLAVLQYRKLFIAIPAAMLLFVLLAPEAVKDRITDMVVLNTTQGVHNPTVESNMNRMRMWRTGLYIFTQYPLTGIGDGDVWHIYREYVTPEDPAEGGHFHNTYIHVLATHGILGFLSMMAMFVAIAWVEFRLWIKSGDETIRAVSIGMLAAFFGFTVNGLAEYNFGDHEILVLLWLTVGVAVACARIQKQSTNEPVGTTMHRDEV